MPVSTLLVVFRSFRHRNFRLYYLGQLVSLHGTWMQTMAQAWLIYRLTDSSLMLGVVAFCSHLPVLVLGLLGGVIADRLSRRRLLFAANTVAMMQALAFAVLTLGGWVAPWHIVVLALVLGMVQAFEMPARHAFVTEIIAREDVPNAIALNSSAFNVARFLGPAIAGWVVAWYGEGTVFLLNALTFVAVLTGLTLIPDALRPHAVSDGSIRQRLGEGLVYAWQQSQIRTALFMAGLVSLLASCVAVLMPVFAKDVFASGPRVLGLLLGAIGVGALIGALRLAHRRSHGGLDARIGAAALGVSACSLLFAVVDTLWLGMVAMVLAGFAYVTAVASTNMLIQLTVDDAIRGRVMSIFSIVFVGFMPIGSLLGGAAAHVIGAPATVILFALLCLIGAIVYLRHIRPDGSAWRWLQGGIIARGVSTRGTGVAKRWVEVARAAEVKPGSMKRVTVEDHALLLASIDGRHYAVDDTCTHEDASLSSGSLRGEFVKCPLHGSRFNVITGAVLDEPAEQDLRTYPVKIEGDAIFVEWQ
jgi:nitrite reductase/ring-hydroxylating ferredoxin subunit/predicted MFS family arabinose efflux permease